LASQSEIELIFCASGNKRFAEIAIKSGFLYGAQLPNTIYFQPYFADQDWKEPDRDGYMDALRFHGPHMATVLDWEFPEQLPDVLGWAEEAAEHVDVVVVIPKVIGGVKQIPEKIGGKRVRLGYSVPSSYGSTRVPLTEFLGRPIHILGGSPQVQMCLAGASWRGRKLLLEAEALNVASVDCNYHMRMATSFNQFWTPGDAQYAKNRWWPTLREADGKRWGDGSSGADAPYEAFSRSCQNISKSWKRLGYKLKEG
jgi:hypothetical protein